MDLTVVNVVLTGICLFVQPDTESAYHSAWFMDGRTMSHHVYLAVSNTAYDIDAKKADGTTDLPHDTEVDGDGANQWVFQLDERLIKVVSLTQEGSLCAHDMERVPRLRDVWPRVIGGAHHGHDDLQEPLRTVALQNRLNSRFALETGELAPSYISSNQWLFQPGVMLHAAKKGPIPQEVTLRSTVVGDSLVLAIYGVDEGNSHLTAKITITKRAADQEISVLLANVPRSDLFPKVHCDTDVDCTKTPDDDCCTDHHFAIYYKAFDNGPANPPLPHKQPNLVTPPPNSGECPRRQIVDFFRVGGSNCGPTQYP